MTLVIAVVFLFSTLFVNSASTLGQNQAYGLATGIDLFNHNHLGGTLFGTNYGWNKNAFGSGGLHGLRVDGYGSMGTVIGPGGVIGIAGGSYGPFVGQGVYGFGNGVYGFNGYGRTGIYGPPSDHGPGAGYSPALGHGMSAAGFTPGSSYGPGVAYVPTAGYDNANAYGYGLDGTPANRGYGLPLLIDLGQSGLEYTGMLGYGDGYGGGYGGGTGGYGGYASGFGGYGGLLTSYQNVYKVNQPDVPKLYVYGTGSGAVDSGIEYTVPATK